MNFLYVNEGYKDFFNYVKQSDALSQIESSVYNPESNISCASSTSFGYFIGENITEIYGKFSFYVNKANPSHSLLKLSFLSDKSASSPICYLEAYPADSSLMSGGFPFKLVFGGQNIYAPSSSDPRHCALVNSFNTVWFHIHLNTSGSSVFEIRFNNNPIFSYNFVISTENLGKLICFNLGSDVYLSNVIMSSDLINANDMIIPLTKTLSGGTAVSVEGGYRFLGTNNSIKFNLSNPDVPQDYETYVSKIVCRVSNVESTGVSEFEHLKFRDTAVSSSYSVDSIPATGDVQNFVVNIDKLSMNTNVNVHSVEIVLE